MRGSRTRSTSAWSAVKVELDRYWDLLRQRRAHEEFGLDPDDTSMRDAGTVEGYDGLTPHIERRAQR